MSRGSANNGGAALLRNRRSRRNPKTGGSTSNFYSSGSTVNLAPTGRTHVKAGTFRTGGATQAPSPFNFSDLEIDKDATFDSRSTVVLVDSLDGAGTYRIGTGLVLGVNDGDGAFSGTIENGLDGTGPPINYLTKRGSGTQTLTGGNTYTGPTTIEDGTLQIGNGGTMGALATGTNVAVDSPGTRRGRCGGLRSLDAGSALRLGRRHSGYRHRGPELRRLACTPGNLRPCRRLRLWPLVFESPSRQKTPPTTCPAPRWPLVEARSRPPEPEECKRREFEPPTCCLRVTQAVALL